MDSFGAEKITRHLGAYLSRQYGLGDHREDAAYKSWDDDCEKYLEAS